MNIVTVYPIVRGAFKDELTYWCSAPLAVGTIIDVPLRGRTIPALVGSIMPASLAKANIKQASFVTRKIEKAVPKKIVRIECIMACEKMSHYYAVPFGSVLKSCIPEVILSSTINNDHATTIDTAEKVEKKEIEDVANPTRNTIASDILIYQTNTADRLSTYKSIVREEFARKKSMMIVAPTVISAEELFNTLRKGIEDYVIILHGSLSKKKQQSIWNDALSNDHPLLIIVTPLFASLPKYDIGTIVLERESSRAYSAVRSPYIDFRDYIESYARGIRARLILGDSLLRIETLHRREVGELSDFFPLSYRVEKSAELLVVDMSNKAAREKVRGTADEGMQNIREGKARSTSDVASVQDTKKSSGGLAKKVFTILSDELHSMIEYAAKKSERCYIFVARRGLSPQTVCGDCGQSVVCEQCHAPVVLHQPKVILGQADQGRFFLCHHCGKQRSALEGCKTCTSWKLVTLGIGVDTVAEEIKKQFPGRSIYQLDKDSVTTDTQAKKVVEEFSKSTDGILIGTESSLAFLPEVTYSGIASLDSFFSIPDFRINERICHIVMRLLEKTTGHVVIQTRNAENPLLKHLVSGNLLLFYREEIAARESIHYPPFVVHIKITVEDTKAAAADKMRRLQEMLEPFESKGATTMIFPAFVPTVRGKSILHMLLTLPIQEWPNEHLRGTLSSLSKDYQVRVNPESLL